MMVLIADIATIVDDRRAAAAAYDRLVPYARLTSGIGSLSREGSIAHRLGCAAELLGRHDDAVSHLTAALAHNRRLRSPIHTAATAFDLAYVLEPDDRTAAAALREEALSIRASCGLEQWPHATGRWHRRRPS